MTGVRRYRHARACRERSPATRKPLAPLPEGRLGLAGAPPWGDVTLTIRPEAVRPEGGKNFSPARVTGVSYLGIRVACSFNAAGAKLRAALPPRAKPHEREDLTARLPAGSL